MTPSCFVGPWAQAKGKNRLPLLRLHFLQVFHNHQSPEKTFQQGPLLLFNR